MDYESLRKLAAEHPYVLLAMMIGFLVRLMKSDTKLPIDIPPAARKYVALSLAVGGAVAEKLAMGVPTSQALFDGVMAWAMAEWGHKILVDDLRGGKEIPVPFLMLPGEAPGPGKPITIPPKKNDGGGGPPNVPPGITALLGALFLMLFIQGCAKFWKVADLAADKVHCLVQNQDLPNESLWLKCAIQDPERYLELLETSRAETKKAVAREKERASSDRSDAGCSSPPDAGAEAGK